MICMPQAVDAAATLTSRTDGTSFHRYVAPRLRRFKRNFGPNHIHRSRLAVSVTCRSRV
jgi:hypothetical protein